MKHVTTAGIGTARGSGVAPPGSDSARVPGTQNMVIAPWATLVTPTRTTTRHLHAHAEVPMAHTAGMAADRPCRLALGPAGVGKTLREGAAFKLLTSRVLVRWLGGE